MERMYNKRIRRHKKIRAKLFGTKDVPRVSVFKSNKNVFVQFIDDLTGKTILSNSILSDKKNKAKGKKTEKAVAIGQALAKKALDMGIKKIVFDRGGFKYHGRIKALAEALRAGGIAF